LPYLVLQSLMEPFNSVYSSSFNEDWTISSTLFDFPEVALRVVSEDNFNFFFLNFLRIVQFNNFLHLHLLF
jgi:hypothetical protein